MKPILLKFFAFTLTAMLFFSLAVCADAVPIELDGYFDDWADKPSQTLTEPWYNNNPGQYHTVKWYVTSTDLYLYIQMAKVGGQPINSYRILWNSGTASGTCQTDPYQAPSGYLWIWDYGKQPSSPLTKDGRIVRGSNSDGLTSDQAEFRIPLSEFGANSQNLSLDLKFPDLGNQTVHIVGANTFPVAGVAVCVVAVGAGLCIFGRKKKGAEHGLRNGK